MPGSSCGPRPAVPKLGTCGSSCMSRPTPWPTRLRMTLKPSASTVVWTAFETSPRRPPGCAACDARVERRLGGGEQAGRLVRDLADRDRDGAVGHPAVLGHAHVDREHVAALERVGVGDAVDHHRVGRGADRAGEAAVALEGRGRALRDDEALGGLVELGGCDARAALADQHLEAARRGRRRPPPSPRSATGS